MDSLNLSNTIDYKKSTGTLTCSSLGMADKSGNTDWVRIFPNPGKDYTIIEIKQEITSLELIDLNGRGMEIPINRENDKIYLQTEVLSPGIYLVKITNSQGDIRFLKWTKVN
jgi:hypothetical protein